MTYSEALLSFALVSVIGAVAALSFGAFREKRDLEKARLNFLLKVSEIKNKLKRDLEEAILTNGATSTINAGDNAEGAEKFFGLGSAHQSDAKLVLQVFKPFNHIFSVAASVTPATERTGGFVNITPWPLTSDAEKSRYWMGAMSSAEYLLMSNDFTSFIFKKGALKTTDVTAGRISSQTLTRLPATQRANFLRTVDRVLWLRISRLRYCLDRATSNKIPTTSKSFRKM